jgi:hypothetical protein
VAALAFDVGLQAGGILAAVLVAAAEWQKGTPTDWSNGAHLLARSAAYAGVPADGPPPKLDQKYVDDNAVVIEKQLERGGVPLAMVLNRALAGSGKAN